MSSLGSLVVSLAMDTARFTSDVGKAGQQLLRLKDNAVKVGAAIGTAFAAGAGALSYMVKGAIDEADKLAKMAQGMGAGAEQLSAMGYAAKLSGIEIEQFSKGLFTLSKRMSDAGKGTGEALGAFEAMGVSVRRTDGTLKSQRDILLEVAEKFATYRDGAEKSALASAVFGEDIGSKLIPYLNQGKDGIIALEDEARALGVVFTDEAGKAAEQFNDNLTRLQSVKKGLVVQITQELLPSLVSVTDRMVNMAKETGLMKTAATTAAGAVRLLATAAVAAWTAFEVAGESIATVVSALYLAATGEFKLAWDVLNQGAKNNATAFRNAGKLIEDIWDTTAKNVSNSAGDNSEKLAAPAIAAAGKAAGSAKKATEKVSAEVKRIQSMLDTMFDDVATYGMSSSQKKLYALSTAGASDAQLREAEALLRMYDELEKAKRSAEEQNEILRQGKAVYEEMRSPIEILSDRFAHLDMLLAKGAITWETYARAALKAQDEYVEAARGPDEAAKRLEETSKSLGMTFSSAFEDAIVSGGNFRELLKGVEQDILRIMTRRLVTEPVSDFLSSAAKSFLPSLFGGARAAGGNVFPGHRYLVGERGPEWLEPSTAGTVSPAAAGNVQVTMNVYGVKDPESFRRSEAQVASRLSSVVSRAGRFS